MTNDPLGYWLTELGNTRSARVFQPSAAGLPWQTRPQVIRPRGLRWLRVAVPLAAAAAIAIVVSGPNVHVTTGPTMIADGDRTAGLVAEDCNRDGFVNGEDIACFVRHQSADGSAPRADDLTRRLLGI
jgi:hypothetical protein